MDSLKNKVVAVFGLDPSGWAAAALLRAAGAQVLGVALENSPLGQEAAGATPGVQIIPLERLPRELSLAVHSNQLSRNHPALQELCARGIELISDLELASRNLFCLSLAVTGTNGKTTTAELIAAMLAGAQRKTVRGGASGLPVCELCEPSRGLDFVTLDLNSFQLESIEQFRPAVAVITNLRSDHMDQYAGMEEYARTVSRVFKNQQAFDWAILQSEALAHLRSLGITPPSKVITFSARNRRADIFLDRGLLISSLPNWVGPLFNMEQTVLVGPHNAENIMAALAVGHVLHLSLEEMTAALRDYRPGPHRQELVAEWGGIRFINNSKAMNVDAVSQSIQAIPGGRGGEPNVWLIAGGKDKSLDYHDLGPLLAQRAKGAFLLGQAREKLRAAWGLFTPCVLVDSLLEAVQRAAESAAEGDVVLLAPACSSFDMFQNYQHRGEMFRQAVQQLEKKADFGPTPAAPAAPAPGK